MDHVIDEIQATGQLSGSGMFGTVYVMPDGTAIKVSNVANSDGWLWWAYASMTEPENPHLPTIHSIHVNVAENTFVAVMDAYELDGEDTGECMSEEAFEAVEHIEEYTHEICPFRLYRDIGGGIENWMQGFDGMEVLTDPYCYDGWRDVMANKSDRTRINAFQDFVYYNPMEGITFV